MFLPCLAAGNMLSVYFGLNMRLIFKSFQIAVAISCMVLFGIICK